MVRDIADRQIHLVAEQIARLEDRRGLKAVYAQVAAPPSVDPQRLVMLLLEVLRDRGSSVEISVVHAQVDRITLQALEFSMDETE